MTSQTHQKKTVKHPNTPTTGYCEDYNGYPSQYYLKDHALPKDFPMGHQQVNQNQPEDRLRPNEHIGLQAGRSDSLEYIYRGAHPHEGSPTHNLSKGMHDSYGSNKFNGSLEAIPSDIKHKVQLPTFGEDQFNMVVAQQQSNSPTHKQSNTSKIDQMLEQHKKRKALQKFYDLKNETDSVSPIPEKLTPSRDSDRISYGLLKEQDLFMNIIEGDWTVEGTSGHRQRQSFGAQSFGVDNSRNMPGLEKKGLIDLMSEQNSSAGETGRFKGSPRWNDVGEEKLMSERKHNESKNSSQTGSTSERKSNLNSSRNTSQESMSPKSKAQANIPKISKNSQIIFKNSQRAKEDEKMIQDLLATKIRQLSNAENIESAGLHRIPEENEESLEKSKLSIAGSPNSKQRASQTQETEEDKGKLPWSLAAEGLISDSLSIPKIRTISDAQSLRLSTGDESPKKQASRRNFESYDAYNASTSSSYVSSPKNLKGTTIIEHKKPLAIDSNLFLKKPANNERKDSPTRQEIKEMVKSPKQIYLKVIDNTANPHGSRDSSPKRKKDPSPLKSSLSQRDSTPESQRKSNQRDSKSYKEIPPEELEKYDEVQRLEIILNNLQHIQKTNLLAQIHALRLSSSKATESPKSPKTPQDWSQYAGEINKDAAKTRTTRQNRSLDKLTRIAKSASPKRMERVDVSVESYCNSAQLRQKLPSQAEAVDVELNSVKNIWRHENGLKKYWAEDSLYDRNQKWLLVKKYKMDQLNESISVSEMKDCSFKPKFIARNYNSLVCSPQRSQVEASQSNFNTDRTPLETNRQNDLDGMVSERNTSERNKSLYKERKNQESYTGLFDLKKNYNLYKSDNIVSKRSEAVTSMINQASEMRRKDFN